MPCLSDLSASQEGPEVRREGRRLVFQLPPGHTHYPQARGIQAAVTGAITLVRLVVVVKRSPVELDDEALAAPQAIHLHPPITGENLGVDRGPRQALMVEEPKKSRLEF